MDNAEEAKSLGRGKVGKGVEADMGNGRGGVNIRARVKSRGGVRIG